MYSVEIYADMNGADAIIARGDDCHAGVVELLTTDKFKIYLYEHGCADLYSQKFSVNSGLHYARMVLSDSDVQAYADGERYDFEGVKWEIVSPLCKLIWRKGE